MLFLDDESLDRKDLCAPDKTKVALDELKRHFDDGSLLAMQRAYVGGGGSAKQSAIKLFAPLPLLDKAAITPQHLLDLGLWRRETAEAAEKLQEFSAGMPRFVPGRVLFWEGELVTLVSVSSEVATVKTTSSGGGMMGEQNVPLQRILDVNQRHILPMHGSRMMLEDGMSADFASALMKSKVVECSLALEPAVLRIGNAVSSNDHHALVIAQCAAVRAIRSCLDIVTFQRKGGERGRDRSRYAKDDVAKMAVYGEGHCRTVSSCMVPFLWAFSELLCLDVFYRMDEHGSHQWLQFDARPSMQSYVCDLYRSDGALDAEESDRLLAQVRAPCFFRLFCIQLLLLLFYFP